MSTRPITPMRSMAFNVAVCLRVEQGDLVLEYDPEHVVFDAALKPPAADLQALYDGLAAISSRYANAIVGPVLPSP